ncbi:MAG TPA: heme ABC exporter ATP-binding protein CcmA [Candidatus Angelobacter sp.]|nr:heme ABC exporter ATP-binding protein CcmA [Candidatus Angelobacter sp.]
MRPSRARPRRLSPRDTEGLRLTTDALPVHVEGVSKIYGRTAAVRNVSLDLMPGKFYVLRGENGAGKSTLLRMIAGLSEPTEGEIQIFGSKPHDAREHMGYMAHAPLLYDEFSGMENLEFFAGLYGIESRAMLTEAMIRVGLKPELTRRVGQYSQGMRQRLSLARAVFHAPQLLLLDEPFSNVDPDSATEIAHLLAAMRNEGKTILLVTHQLGLLSKMADEFLFLSAGALVNREAVPQGGA